MLRNLEVLRDSERDLVNGYYHLNSNKYIPKVVTQLSMMYLWILDEFIDDKTNKDINNEDIDSDISISGLNQTIVQCEYGGITSFVYGKNIISSSYTYYHWRFRILNHHKLNKTINDDNEYNFIIGIKQTDSDSDSASDDNNVYSFVGSHGLISCNKDTPKPYTNRRFNRTNDVLDMYLNFENRMAVN